LSNSNDKLKVCRTFNGQSEASPQPFTTSHGTNLVLSWARYWQQIRGDITVPLIAHGNFS